jgi:O-antigen ligase
MSLWNIRSYNQNIQDFNGLRLFLILSSCFFLFAFTSVFRSNLGDLFNSLSPMLPIPFIGILIILHSRIDLKISSKELSKFAQISILFLLIVYVLLKAFSGQDSILHSFHTGRLTMFSGNPIPFSFCILGLSIFCLADWRPSNKKNKLIAFLLFITGIYFAGFLSGTRGTLFAILLIAPIIIFYLSNSFKISLFIISSSTLFAILIFQANSAINLEQVYFNRIKTGLETIVLLENKDESIWFRLDMWSAGIKAFFEAPILGHGITERFIAAKPHLNNQKIGFTHPHNDIVAGFISSGVLGGIAVLISLMSGFSAAILTPNRNTTKLYLALMLSCSTMVTGNVSTVLFNDICSSWLAFSTYLIWATDFKDEPPSVEN